MSIVMFDRLTFFCIVYRSSDDVFHLRCGVCQVWAEEVLFVALHYASPIDTL